MSLRSVRRDLAQLREKGVVLDAEPGRGGGVRLGRRSSLPRLQLSHREAMTLLTAAAGPSSARPNASRASRRVACKGKEVTVG